ncbi:hypothetical protein M422DRAFT_25483 [Sphaerobolus stellatus SS14]|nr:hypothetical protein M422DRAFT_25483 [Sphaerobolus stellatus SS14]
MDTCEETKPMSAALMKDIQEIEEKDGARPCRNYWCLTAFVLRAGIEYKHARNH